jgi:NAD(P)H-dependent FMN reductase
VKLNTAVIYGSVRGERRQGIKAARFVIRNLEQRGHAVTLVDAMEYALPLLDLMHKEFDPGQAPEAMESISRILMKADGFIVVSAEYNHGEPAALKNLLDHFQREYLYKPNGIVTYSAGPFGGVRALITLRAILAELGTPSIPSSFPISKIGTAFNDDGEALDQAYDRRVVKFLDEFEWYANALKNARERGEPGEDAPAQQQICRGDNDTPE